MIPLLTGIFITALGLVCYKDYEDNRIIAITMVVITTIGAFQALTSLFSIL